MATGWFGSERRFGSGGGVRIGSAVRLRGRCGTRFGLRSDDGEGNLQGQPVGASPGGGGARRQTQLPA